MEKKFCRRHCDLLAQLMEQPNRNGRGNTIKDFRLIDKIVKAFRQHAVTGAPPVATMPVEKMTPEQRTEHDKIMTDWNDKRQADFAEMRSVELPDLLFQMVAIKFQDFEFAPSFRTDAIIMAETLGIKDE